MDTLRNKLLRNILAIIVLLGAFGTLALYMDLSERSGAIYRVSIDETGTVALEDIP